MRYFRSLFVVVGLLLGSATLAAADAKMTAVMGNLYYNGAAVCGNIRYTPNGQYTITAMECTDRAALTASNSCGTFKALMVQRAAAQYSLDLTAEDIQAQNCPQ